MFKMLRDQRNITQVSFRMKTFSGSPRYLVDSLYLRCVMNEIRRLFAWGPSYQYFDHRPPTIKNELGQDLSLIHPISAKEMVKEGIYLYHYEQLFPKQVFEKISYYSEVKWTKEYERIGNWVNDCYMNLKSSFPGSYGFWISKLV